MDGLSPARPVCLPVLRPVVFRKPSQRICLGLPLALLDREKRSQIVKSTIYTVFKRGISLLCKLFADQRDGAPTLAAGKGLPNLGLGKGGIAGQGDVRVIMLLGIGDPFSPSILRLIIRLI